MRVKALEIRAFRNIRELLFLPTPGVNVIFGENAQGKTNLLEAVWLFSGARSFRGAKDSEYIAFEKESSSLLLTFDSGQREETAQLVFAREGKSCRLNGVKQESRARLAGEFCTVVFSPEHLGLVKDGPEKRRKMIDISLGQAYPKYGKILDSYEKTLKQRNRLLKEIPRHASLLDTLEVWDLSLLEYGAYITRMRSLYVARLCARAQEVYNGISKGKERFSASYEPSFGGSVEGFTKQDYKNSLARAIKESRAEDLRLGTTCAGPHRDDLSILVDEKSARAFGSQGQQRSCVLALKLAECAILEERGGKAPVVLLDDVMSELDEGRRKYLLNQLEGRQVLITCCDAGSFEGAADANILRLHAGCFVEQSGRS